MSMRRCYEKLREKNVCSLQGISAATANKQPPVERNRPNSGVNHREFTSDRSWFGEKEKKKKKRKNWTICAEIYYSRRAVLQGNKSKDSLSLFLSLSGKKSR